MTKRLRSKTVRADEGFEKDQFARMRMRLSQLGQSALTLSAIGVPMRNCLEKVQIEVYLAEY
jgi:hypothetical protein